MESPNVALVPVNREGALELGLNPCNYCDSGWGTYSTDARPLSGIPGTVKMDSCHKTCEFHRRSVENILMKSVKGGGLF